MRKGDLEYAIYPNSKRYEGWSLAERLYEDIKEKRKWKDIEVKNINFLRDVLNAAWYCRIIAPDDVMKSIGGLENLGEETKLLCKRIIANKNESESKSSVEKYVPMTKQPQRGG